MDARTMTATEIQTKREALNLPNWYDDRRVEEYGTYWIAYTDPKTGFPQGFLAVDGSVVGRGRDGVVFDSAEEAEEFAEVFGGMVCPRA